jgi:DNA-binding NtrC family response regulator
MSTKPHIIVIEDDEGNRRTVTRALEREGYDVKAFAEAESGLEYLREHRDIVLVITDLMLPGTDGFGVLETSRSIDPEVGLLMITGHGSVESAVEAMKRGADDYLTKPVDLFELRKRTSAIVEKHRLTRRVSELESRLGERFKIVGQSKPMQDLFRQMELVAPARANVLMISESGTGKELVANALHENSPRLDKRFLPINCAAIPSEILESELFGHERGAFTGATARKRGKFELADGGTVFLDEIGELPHEMQAKLLRVLEQQEFMRVGGTDTIRVDIRVIAATNSDLEAAVEENQRKNLHFSAEAMRTLVQAPWEGNVRELRNLVESVAVLAPQDEVRVEDLPEEYQGEPPPAEALAMPTAPGSRVPLETEGLTMEEIERRAILNALEGTGGNRTRAASILGIGLRTLQRKLKEYRLAGKD